MRRNIALALAAVVLTSFTLEMAARFYQGVIRGQSVEDSAFSPCYRDFYFLGPSFKPGAACNWQGIENLTINSLGFRGEEFSVEKPEGTFRIVAFGSSTSNAGNYPQKLEALLRERGTAYPFRRIEVINAAVPTWTTTQSLIQFLTRGIYLKPDLILVFEAINDSHLQDAYWVHHLKEVDYSAHGGFLERHSQLYNFARNRIERVQEALEVSAWRRSVERAAGGAGGETSTAERAGAAARSASTQIFETDLTSFIAVARQNGVAVGLITMPLNHDPNDSWSENALRAGFAYADFENLVRRVAQLNEVTRAVARRDGALLIDAATGSFGLDRADFVDLCHFSEKGARVFAGRVFESLDPWLKSARKPTGN